MAVESDERCVCKPAPSLRHVLLALLRFKVPFVVAEFQCCSFSLGSIAQAAQKCGKEHRRAGAALEAAVPLSTIAVCPQAGSLQ